MANATVPITVSIDIDKASYSRVVHKLVELQDRVRAIDVGSNQASFTQLAATALVAVGVSRRRLSRRRFLGFFRR